MVTVSHLTKKILQEKPFVHEALEKDIINIGALAEMIKPDIEKELGEVKTSAISMAIRRYMEKNNKEFYQKIKIVKKSDLLIKSNLFEISILKSPTIYEKLMRLYEVVDFNVGDTLNIIQGNYEILIVSNEKYKEAFLEALENEQIKIVRGNISSISVKIPKECIDTPGFYFVLTKALSLENIPILDIVNTETEATLIIEDKYIAKAYDILKREISIEYYEK